MTQNQALLPAADRAPQPHHYHLPPGSVEVRVDQPSEVDQALTEAIAVVSPTATEHRVGIMVTRIGPGIYTVRAHPEVPFGLTRQRYI